MRFEQEPTPVHVDERGTCSYDRLEFLAVEIENETALGVALMRIAVAGEALMRTHHNETCEPAVLSHWHRWRHTTVLTSLPRWPRCAKANRATRGLLPGLF